ncbi:unnamed protein product [Rhizophagus irregularis]|nr:unnamed protein product [Rhizophagus irregularis]
MDTRNSSLNYSKTKWTRDFGTPKLSEISKQFLVLQFYGNVLKSKMGIKRVLECQFSLNELDWEMDTKLL